MIQNTEAIKDVKPDPRGRIPLGAELTKGVSHYKVFKGDEGEIVLVPYVDIPQRELWLWQNKDALAGIEESFKQAESGKLEVVDPKFLHLDDDE